MTSHRSIAFALALILALCYFVCSMAMASTLLSGYGGPGSGEQVILGSQLLNTPSGSAGARATTASALESAGPALGSTIQSAGSPAPEANQAEGGTRAPRPSAARSDQPSRAARSGPSSPASQSVGQATVSTQVSYDLRSGLSDGELALIALVVAVLLALALGTRRLSKFQR